MASNSLECISASSCKEECELLTCCFFCGLGAALKAFAFYYQQQCLITSFCGAEFVRNVCAGLKESRLVTREVTDVSMVQVRTPFLLHSTSSG
jgi:hypothetical protein